MVVYNIYFKIGSVLMKRIKILGIIVVMLAVLMTTVFATVGSRTVELMYNNIRIMLNGREVVPTDAYGNAVEPFIIDGTTYLPVRAIANALGLNVGWNDETKTVILDNTDVFSGGVQVYEDEFVTLEFIGCRAPDEDDWFDYYYADFYVKNKTDAELTFQPDSIAFNGVSYELSGSESVAPQSIGKISFYTSNVIPTRGISVISGQVKVIDFDYAENKVFGNKLSYNAKWVNVTQD